MRGLAVLIIAGCGSQGPDVAPRTFEFGPYELQPGEEISDQCVSATLNNDEPLYINSVELTTGPGVHHSNWLWVPDNRYQGPDGTWKCDERGFDEADAGINGGVVFAQSTQAPHEVQAFEPGAAVLVPPRSRIVAGTHLLNATDQVTNVGIALTITPIAEPTTLLAGMALENEAIALPPLRKSRFTVVCDVDAEFQAREGRPVDFSLYYALPHYHTLGTGITLDAVREDGSSTTIFTTDQRIGDALGGAITPAFSLAGYKQLRFSCNYDNPRDTVVRWGVGDQEMCVFLAFTDSTYSWPGGAIMQDAPGTEVDHGDYVEFTHACVLLPVPANR